VHVVARHSAPTGGRRSSCCGRQAEGLRNDVMSGVIWRHERSTFVAPVLFILRPSAPQSLRALQVLGRACKAAYRRAPAGAAQPQ
jgi:hypothetical protein